MDDGQAALFQGSDAHGGGLQLGAGEEHQLAVAGAQVALGSDLGGCLGIRYADLIDGLGEVGEGLAGAVDGGRNHLGVEAGCGQRGKSETGKQED